MTRAAAPADNRGMNSKNNSLKRIRIFVAIDAAGRWSAMGGSGTRQSEAVEFVLDEVGAGDLRRVYQIDVDIPIPQIEDLGPVPATVREVTTS